MNFFLSLTWLHAWVCMVLERGFQSVHVWAHWYPAEPAWDTLPLPLTPLPPSEPISLMLHSCTVVQPFFQLGSVLFSWQEEAGRVFPDQVRLGFAGCQIYLGLRTRHYRTKHSCRRHTAFWGEVLIQPCSSVTTVCAPVCLCKDLMLDAFSYLSTDSSKQNKTLWQFKKASKNITENGAFKSTKFKLFLCKRICHLKSWNPVSIWQFDFFQSCRNSCINNRNPEEHTCTKSQNPPYSYEHLDLN